MTNFGIVRAAAGVMRHLFAPEARDPATGTRLYATPPQLSYTRGWPYASPRR